MYIINDELKASKNFNKDFFSFVALEVYWVIGLSNNAFNFPYLKV